MWYQKTLTLSAKSRGFHLVTDEILNQLADMPRVNIGLLHLLLQHTSASLTLNENCDPTVRHDMERFFLRSAKVRAFLQFLKEVLHFLCKDLYFSLSVAVPQE